MDKNVTDLSLLASSLRGELTAFCAQGPRNSTKQIREAERFITDALGLSLGDDFEGSGAPVIQLQLVPTRTYGGDVEARFNIILRTNPRVRDHRYLFTAHYDTVASTHGADDNASGVVSLLALYRRLPVDLPADFVFFTNEEPPHFGGSTMGSQVYFDRFKQRRMGRHYAFILNFDCVGYFIEKDSPKFIGGRVDFTDADLMSIRDIPSDTAGFIVSKDDRKSKELLSWWGRDTEMRPIEAGDGNWLGMLSDQRWVFGGEVPTVQITDMALTRSKIYHTMQDTPDTLNYGRMADIVSGVTYAISRDWSIYESGIEDEEPVAEVLQP